MKTFNLSKITWFFILCPFISPIPIQSDVQPFFFLLIILIIIKDCKKIKIANLTLISILWSIILFLFSFQGFDFYKIKICIPYLLVPFLIQFSITYFKDLTPNLLGKVIHFNFIGFILQMILPGMIFSRIGSLIVSSIKISNIRLINGFSPETGLMSGLIFGYLLILLSIKEKYSSKFQFIRHLIIIIIMLLLTLSGSTISYFIITISLLVFQGTYYISNQLIVKNKLSIKSRYKILIIYFLIFSSIFVFLLFSLQPFEGLIRFNQIYINLFFKTSNFSNFIFNDLSSSSRLLSLLTGFYSLLIHPFGVNGIASKEYLLLAKDVVEKITIFHPDTVFVGNVSSFSEALIIGGIFHLLFILYLIYLSIKNNKSTLDKLVFLSGLTFHTFSFGTLFPLGWIFLSFSTISKKGSMRI